MTLQNIFLHLHLRHNKLYKSTDKNKNRPFGRFFIVRPMWVHTQHKNQKGRETKEKNAPLGAFLNG